MQHVLLLRNGNLYSIYTIKVESSLILKSLNQKFPLFLKSLNKQSIQYFIKGSKVSK